MPNGCSIFSCFLKIVLSKFYRSKQRFNSRGCISNMMLVPAYVTKLSGPTPTPAYLLQNPNPTFFGADIKSSSFSIFFQWEKLSKFCSWLYFLLILSNIVNAVISPQINNAVESHTKWDILSPHYWALPKTHLSCDFQSVFPYSPILCPLESSQTAELILSSCFSFINLVS